MLSWTRQVAVVVLQDAIGVRRQTIGGIQCDYEADSIYSILVDIAA
jgi:hypothetical protein